MNATKLDNVKEKTDVYVSIEVQMQTKMMGLQD